MRRLARPFALCFASLLLGACHGHDSTPVEPIAGTSGKAPTATAAKPAPSATAHAPAPATSTTRAKPAAAVDDSFRIAALTLGSAIDARYAVTAPATRFADNTPVIYAAVATTGRTASATLNARWRYLEGQGVLVNELQQTVATDGPAVTTFKVQNPNRWPVGKYSVEISLNGKPAASRDFEIGNR